MEGFLFGACCQLFGIPTLKKDSVEAGVVMMEGDQQMLYPDSLTPDRMHIISHEDNLFINSESEKPTEKNTAATLKEAMTSLEYNDDFTKNPDDELNEKIIEISNHFIKNPSTLAVSMSALSSTEKYLDLTSSGVAQITNSLLQSGPDIITVDAGGNSDTGLFSHSTISHEESDTILVDKNGMEIIDVSRPSEFSGPGADIYVSTMQSKPAVNAIQDSSTTPANSFGVYAGEDGIEEKQSTTDLMTSIPTKYYTKFSTKPQEHITEKPIYQKPGFRPKPTKIPAKENFVLVQTVTRPQNPLKNSVTSAEVNQELASVESIITMLNGSFSMNQNPNKHVTTEMPHTSKYPSKYSSSYPTYFDPSYETTTFKYPTGGHFITSSANKQTTSKPNSNSLTKLPSFGSDAYPNKYGSSNGYFTRKPVLRNVTKYPEDITNNLVSSTLSYDEYWGSPSTTVDRKPPSTSYVYSPVPTKRPESNIHNVVPIHEATSGNLDNFASVTPTVIVLSDLNSQYDHTPDPNKFIKSPVKPIVDDLPLPILVNRISEIEPVIKKPTTMKPEVTTPRPKKPANEITINNIVTSTNVINFGATHDQNIGGRPDDDNRPQVQSENEVTNEVEKEDEKDKKDEKDKVENEKEEAEIVDSEKVEVNKIGEAEKVEEVEIGQIDKVEADKLGDAEKVDEEVAGVVSNDLPKQKTTTEKTIDSTILITPKPSYSKPGSSGNSKPVRPGAAPTKKPAKKKSTTTSTPLTNPTTSQIYVQTSSDDLINFPPVRNPNLNSTGTVPGIFTGSNTTSFIDPILQEVEFTTPALMLQEDDELNEKMSLFVNKIVGSLQGTFQELHDIVILDKTPNATISNQNNKTPTTKKPATKKPTKKPTRIATTTVSTTTPTTTTTTKKPARVTTKKPTTVVVTQAATTKKPPTRVS